MTTGLALLKDGDAGTFLLVKDPCFAIERTWSSDESWSSPGSSLALLNVDVAKCRKTLFVFTPAFERREACREIRRKVVDWKD
jgi:hypothetical protein